MKAEIKIMKYGNFGWTIFYRKSLCHVWVPLLNGGTILTRPYYSFHEYDHAHGFARNQFYANFINKFEKYHPWLSYELCGYKFNPGLQKWEKHDSVTTIASNSGIFDAN